MLNVFLPSPPVPTMSRESAFRSSLMLVLSEAQKFVYRDAAHGKYGEHSGDLCVGIALARDLVHDGAGLVGCQTFVAEESLQYLFHLFFPL